MSQLVLTSTLPLALLCYSRLGKELRFRYAGWDVTSLPPVPTWVSGAPGEQPHCVHNWSCLQTQNREGREVGRLVAKVKHGAPRTRLTFREKGLGSTAPSQKEAGVPASVVASTTTGHLRPAASGGISPNSQSPGC